MPFVTQMYNIQHFHYPLAQRHHVLLNHHEHDDSAKEGRALAHPNAAGVLPPRRHPVDGEAFSSSSRKMAFSSSFHWRHRIFVVQFPLLLESFVEEQHGEGQHAEQVQAGQQQLGGVAPQHSTQFPVQENETLPV